MLEGHSGAFGNVVMQDGQDKAAILAFWERNHASPEANKLRILDLKPGGAKVQKDITMAPDAPGDFAISMVVSEKYGVIFKITKQGFLYLFDCGTGTNLFRYRISQEAVFIGAPSARTGGMLLVNRKGLVMSANVNEQTIVNFVMTNLPHEPNASDIAFGLARRYGLPGAEDMMNQQFARYFAAQDYKNAARMAAQSKALRNPETVAKFQQAPQVAGQPGTPVIVYFSALLEYGKLSAYEALELAKPAVMQGRREMIEKWLTEDKLECSEELGDLVKTIDGNLALKIYLKAETSPKVVQSFVELGQYDQIVAYVRKVGYKTDFSFILRNMLMGSPEAAFQFAKQLLEPVPGVGPLMDINTVVDVFLSQSRLQEATQILLTVLT